MRPAEGLQEHAEIAPMTLVLIAIGQRAERRSRSRPHGVGGARRQISMSTLAGCIAMNISNSTSNVSNTSSAASIKKVTNQPIEKQVPTDAPKQLPITDRVEISGMSGMLQSLKAGNDFRADKVADIKAQIEAGTYESDEKLDVAADRLLDDLLK
jgi:negative regulator of flagellin synthesis FlgM